MRPLFSKSSLVLLESLSFTRSLYAFDFDGTLSPIVAVPSAATLSQSTEDLLRQLSEFASVAIVSGRSVQDLRERLSFEPHYLVGNHGLEGLPKNRDALKESEDSCRRWKAVLSKIDFGMGVELEDKAFSLAIHYRRSRNKKDAKGHIKRAVESLSPAPRVIPGKSVINLLSPGAPHKGMAMIELMKDAGVKSSFYIGDDDTDEDVFGLPDEQGVFSVRVGEKKSSQARYFIKRQSEINKVLTCLIKYHRVTVSDGKARIRS